MDNQLSLLNPVDVPTNARGNAVDLAFSNIPLADAVVEEYLATSSDHFTLSITLPELAPAPLPIGKIRLSSDEELKRFVELVEAGAAAVPVTTTSTSELDDLASALVNLLGCAARAAGRPARKTTHDALWWTEECAKAAANYGAWRRVYPLGFDREVQLAKREFHNVVRRAKHLYWRNLIDSFSDSDSVFRTVRWLKSPGPFQAPPLQVDGRVYETQLEKANALRRATLERRTANDDIADPWGSVNTRQTVPFADQVSFETRDATLCTGNTSPGSDNITVRMLRAVWHAIGSLVHQLYQGCLSIGHHPKPFREAEVVMIAKPGRRDLFYTPRLAPPWASVHFGVLHPQQAGALPKWSAVDLVAALVHDIEEAFTRKQVATLVTLDVQGAFDRWPPNLAHWVDSFMQDRSARIRYQDTVTDSSPLQCGLPQGSPVSPILFLLYTEPVYRLGNAQGRFGYADDTAILRVGNSLDETSAEASHHVRELVSWGAANGIAFDPEKTEVMHFSRTTPKTAPPVLHGEVEKRPDRAMRWLGVWLDSALAFKTHVEKWTAKAQAVAFHLRKLTNTKHGPLPSAVRRAVYACVIPVLLYVTDAWYPGPTSPRWTKPSKEGPSGIGHLVKKMSNALYTSLRAILPVWRTTPTNVLHREAGIPPVPLLLDARRMAFAARLKALDEAHPLVKRTSRPKAPIVNKMIKLKYQKQSQPFRTRLRRTDELLSSCPRPALLQRGSAEEQTAPLQSASKNGTTKRFRDWLQALPPRTLVVYSDGSRSAEGHVGYGYAVRRDGSTVLSGKGRLEPAEVFDDEAKGALEGLKAALSLPSRPPRAYGARRATPHKRCSLSSNLWRENTELWSSVGSQAMLTSQVTRRRMLWQRQELRYRNPPTLLRHWHI
ncbi:hypothetical protein HIM_11849 [Hirsutella minnesotensis 3608]|uniref:Reverse transcriptase domain-containing protein n=1 Tax=Hirsutella minnesotensis 3608 TaxID=1043627 RepID=A0A0F7ZIP7_9HYPO|nr:hypothetical protein HIM_11849 [Hirsutella minnesotensis 3608]